MKRLTNKLKQNKGETLTEVLVGLLIACLATALFASMLDRSAKIIESSSSAMAEYYAGNSNLLSHSTSKTAGTISLNLYSVVQKDGVTGEALKYENTNSDGELLPLYITQLLPDKNSLVVDYYLPTGDADDDTGVSIGSYRLSPNQTGGSNE